MLASGSARTIGVGGFIQRMNRADDGSSVLGRVELLHVVAGVDRINDLYEVVELAHAGGFVVILKDDAFTQVGLRNVGKERLQRLG